MARVAKPYRNGKRPGWLMAVTLPNGERKTSKSFEKYADAAQWGADELAAAKAQHHSPVLGGPSRATLAAALDYYGRLYSVHKGGVGAELARINRYLSAAAMPELTVVNTEQGGIAVVARSPSSSPSGLQVHAERRRAKRSGTNAMRNSLALKTCGHLTTANLREFHAVMTQEGLSESTIQKEIAMLKTMFNVAVEEWQWGAFRNPCTSIKLGKSKRRFVKLDAAQRAAMDEALAECENPYFWPLVVVAKETTWRQKTLLSLRWADIDLEGRSTLASTKTGQRLHTFSKPVQALLQQLPRDPSGLVFPLSKTAVTQAWNRMRARANLPDLQYRDLRHLGATDWVRRGMSSHVLQRVLGHNTIATAQYYVDLVSEDVGRALDDAMERSAPLVLPPSVMSDAKAHQTQKAVARLQRALALKKSGTTSHAHGQTLEAATDVPAMRDSQMVAEGRETASPATESSLQNRNRSALSTSIHREAVSAFGDNVIPFRPRKGAKSECSGRASENS